MTENKLHTGRRKEAAARVRITPGTGKFIVNHKECDIYFGRDVLRMIVRQPFGATDSDDKWDVWCTVRGGGKSGQAGAIRHGLSNALCRTQPELRAKLKAAGLLTRDARKVERKKPGKAGARKSFQFSKR